MEKYILTVDGMHCGMCEARVNDEIRNKFKIKSVKSSHSSGETEIIAENLDIDKVKGSLSAIGYEVKDIKQEQYEKKGFFSFLKK